MSGAMRMAESAVSRTSQSVTDATGHCKRNARARLLTSVVPVMVFYVGVFFRFFYTVPVQTPSGSASKVKVELSIFVITAEPSFKRFDE